MVLEIFPKV
jgi:hypothetical protein